MPECGLRMLGERVTGPTGEKTREWEEEEKAARDLEHGDTVHSMLAWWQTIVYSNEIKKSS